MVFKIEKRMTEPRRIGNKYHVYDHILNITRIFKKKAEADEFCEVFNKGMGGTTEPQTDNPENKENAS